MYAVIETGGKQYRVELGSEIRVDRLDVRSGEDITLGRVLLVADEGATAIGRPVVDGATVTAQVLGQDRGDKIVVFKYKQKTRRRVKKGFRAELTTLRISDIAFDGKSAAEIARSSASEKAEAAAAAEEAAAEKAAADKALAARLAAASQPPATAAPAKGARATAKPAATAAGATAAETETAEPSADAPPEGLRTDDAADPGAGDAVAAEAAAAGAAEASADADTRKDE